MRKSFAARYSQGVGHRSGQGLLVNEHNDVNKDLQEHYREANTPLDIRKS